MKNSTRRGLILGLILLVFGLVIIIGSVIAGATGEKAAETLSRTMNINLPEVNKEDYYTMSEAELIPIGTTFPASSIKRVKLDIGAAEAIIVDGSEFSVQATDDICSVKQNGDMLKISSRPKRWFNFFGNLKKRQVKITLPSAVPLEELDIELGAGSLVCISPIKCRYGKVEVGMGQCRLENIEATNSVDIECGMGAVEVNGSIKGDCKIECGMGEVKMKVNGNPMDYSYVAEVGMGSIKINETEIGGVGSKTSSPYSAANKFKVECGMGAVIIKIGE